MLVCNRSLCTCGYSQCISHHESNLHDVSMRHDYNQGGQISVGQNVKTHQILIMLHTGMILFSDNKTTKASNFALQGRMSDQKHTVIIIGIKTSYLVHFSPLKFSSRFFLNMRIKISISCLVVLSNFQLLMICWIQELHTFDIYIKWCRTEVSPDINMQESRRLNLINGISVTPTDFLEHMNFHPHENAISYVVSCEP